MEDLIYGVEEIVAFMSQDTTLLPGTVILTGTTEGIGYARKPPLYMKPGDLIEVEVEAIGKLANPVASAATSAATAV